MFYMFAGASLQIETGARLSRAPGRPDSALQISLMNYEVQFTVTMTAKEENNNNNNSNAKKAWACLGMPWNAFSNANDQQ